MKRKFAEIAAVIVCLMILAVSAYRDSNPHMVSQSQADRLTIGVIALQDDQFQRLLQLAMKREADRQGAEVMMTNSGSQLAKEVDAIESYVEKGVDGLCISPVSVEASMPALKKAYEEGVKIYSVHMSMEDDFQAGYIEMDQEGLGKITGEACRTYIENKLGGKARIGILQFKSQLADMSARRTKGFLSAIKEMPGVEVVADMDAWMVSSGVSTATEMISANPEIDIIWAANEGGTISATLAVKNTGNAGRIVVFGTDSGEQIAKMLLDDDNILQFVTGQDPDTMGKIAMQSIMNTIRGKEIKKRTVIPGIPLSRANPGEVEAYLKGMEIKLRQ